MSPSTIPPSHFRWDNWPANAFRPPSRPNATVCLAPRPHRHVQRFGAGNSKTHQPTDSRPKRKKSSAEVREKTGQKLKMERMKAKRRKMKETISVRLLEAPLHNSYCQFYIYSDTFTLALLRLRRSPFVGRQSNAIQRCARLLCSFCLFIHLQMLS